MTTLTAWLMTVASASCAHAQAGHENDIQHQIQYRRDTDEDEGALGVAHAA